MNARISFKKVAVLGVVAVLALPACTTKKDLDALRMDVNRNTESRIQQTQNPIVTKQADLWAEIETIKSRLDGIQGQLDGVTRAQGGGKGPTTEELARQVNAVRQAVQQLGGDVSAGPVSTPEGQAVPMSALDANQARAALSSDPGAAIKSAVIPMPGQAPAPGAPGQAPAPGAGAPDVAQQLFDRAVAAFKDNKYDDAQRMFGEFSTTFKKHALLADSLAWRGDSLFQLNKYAEAVLVYDEVRSKFPKSPKVPAVMLKEGICLYKLGKKEAGKHILRDVVKRFPNAPQAKAASQYMDRNG